MRTVRYLRVGNVVHLPVSARFLTVALGLLAVLAAMSCAALLLGTAEVGPVSVLRWLFGHADGETDALMLLRAPRIAVALLGGAMTAASGYLLQAVSGNGLADPGLIGISHGTAAAILLGATLFALPPEWLPFAGLAGGLATGALVLALAAWVGASNGLVLIGLAVGVTLGALVEIVMVGGGVAAFARYMTWSHGSLTAVSGSDVGRLSLWAALVFPPMLAMTRSLAPLGLGTEQAAVLGAAPRLARPFLTLLAAALVAPVVSVAGPISFLGLIAAHVARRLVGERPGEVLPVAMLVGALLLLGADIAGRTLFLPMIVPAGLLVSIAGVAGFLAAARAARP